VIAIQNLRAFIINYNVNDELPVTNEDVLYDFVIKWVRNHYPIVDERRQVLSNKLCHLIRCQNMSHQTLREALSSTDLNNMCTTKAVLDLLFFEGRSTSRNPLQ